MKKFTKQILSLIVCFLMAFSVACGTTSRSSSSISKNTSTSKSSSQSVQNSTQSSSTNSQSSLNSSSSSQQSSSSNLSSSSTLSNSSLTNSSSSSLSSSSLSSLSSSSSSSSSTSTSSSSSSSILSSSSSSSSSSCLNSSSTSSGTSSSETPEDPNDITNYIVATNDIPLRLLYDEPAPIMDSENYHQGTTSGSDLTADDSWEEWSIPIGNAYFGANVFGRTETERIQISEKTLTNPNKYINGSSVGGLNNFSETYIDFGHSLNGVSNYKRYLDMKTAVSGVDYTYNGVNYSREYFTSYPDKVFAIHLSADTLNSLSFTLRPTIPFKQSYMWEPGDNISKTGTVTSSVNNGVGHIELSGKLSYYDIDFLGLYKVYIDGGTMTAGINTHSYTNSVGETITDTDGTIVVKNATNAYIFVTLGTDYELSSDIFMSDSELVNCLNNEHMDHPNAVTPTKLTSLADTRLKVQSEMSCIENHIATSTVANTYTTLKNRHVADHYSLFGRVTLDLNCNESDFNLTTDELLNKYKNDNNTYVENLLFQYGRYMLIASSRPGTLPNHLQGVWNTYSSAPWSCNYTHNINVQMNYWPAFSTNLAETFDAYLEYNKAYLPAAERWADLAVVWNGFNSVYDQDGGNGWALGHAANPFKVTYDASPGNLGFTTQLFWEHYAFTQDKEKLEEYIYPALYSAAQFITKMVVQDENGNYLVKKCDSPEQYVNGVWYYTTGTTYAQSFSYLNNYNLLLAAKELGIDLNDNTVLSQQENAVLKTVLQQIDHYDPINVGLSGQIKEFREEEYYGDLGEWKHRHISQLAGLFPGNVINSTTTAWLDAAKVSLTERGFEGVGWSSAHKINLWARLKDGNTARYLLSNLINDCIAPNLWDLYFRATKDTFQIEGNFGATSGMAEFLLQSDAGYIEPLAALPDTWNTGSYNGLVARGNFEISAVWENSTAKAFNILSKSGGKASVYYPTITSATVCTLDGTPVSYTIDGTNLISFDTEVGQTYIIYGFTPQVKPSAPAELSYTRVGFNAFDITWTSVSNADSYNLYLAVENQPTYTLIGNTTNNQFSYLPTDNLNARMTFAVTAVKEGVESFRTVCYYNPIDPTATITSAYGSVNENGALQVVVNANNNTAKYRLYEKQRGTTTYQLVNESAFPLLYLENYNAKNTYAVTVVSYYDGSESEPFELNSISNSPSEYNPLNILEGKAFVGAHGTSYTYDSAEVNWPYAKLTDGIIDVNSWQYGRFSTTNNGYADGTVDLYGTYILSNLKIYLYQGQVARAGKNFTLQVLSNGTWVDIVANLTNEQLASSYLVSTGSGYDQTWLEFDLNGIEAQKIRFYSEALSGNSVTLYEITCSGILVKEGNKNILTGKEFVGAPGTEVIIEPQNDVDGSYSKLTDGVIDINSWKNGRFSSTINGYVDGTIDLGGIYSLTEIRLFAYQANLNYAGKNFTLQVYYNGSWTDIVKNLSNEQLATYTVENGKTYANTWISFALNGVKAEKIRIYCETVTNYSVSFYELECSGTLINETSNILKGKEFVGAPGADANVNATEDFGYSKLTDGIIDVNSWQNGRFSSLNNGRADGTIDLGGLYTLNQIRFYYYQGQIARMGTNFTLQIYHNGSWTNIVTNLTNEQLKAYEINVGTGYDQKWVQFNLNNMQAEKIRFYSEALSGNTVTLYEITCSGYKTLSGHEGNVLLNANATLQNGSASDTNPISNAFDNNQNTFCEVLNASSYSLEIDLQTNQVLQMLKIHELIESSNLINGVLSSASNSTTVEIFVNGVWIKLYDGFVLDSDSCTLIPLYGVQCSKIRLTFKNTRLFDGENSYRLAKIKEIECSTNAVSTNLVDLAKALQSLSYTTNTNLEYVLSQDYIQLKNIALSVSTLTQEQVDEYTSQITK